MVTGASADQVGLIAHGTDQPVGELMSRVPSLEKAFMDLTRDAGDYAGKKLVS